MPTAESYSYAASEWFGSADSFRDALGFTPAELAENRRGRIPPNQARRLLRRARSHLALPTALFALLSMVATTLLLNVFTAVDVFAPLRSVGIELPVVYFPLLALVAILLAIAVSIEGWFDFARLRKLRRDLHAGRAAVTEGVAHFNSDLVIGPNLSARCWLVVNNIRFEVAANAPMGLPSRGMCRIYHTPGSNLVLSVESV